MSGIIYQDKYKVTIPKVVDYGCIFLAVFLFFFLAACHFPYFWCTLLFLCVPFILSKFSGNIYCTDDKVAIYDIFHGKRVFSIESIKSVEIKLYAHKEGIGILWAHHFIVEMKIITEHRKYKYRMDVKPDDVKSDFFEQKIDMNHSNIAFWKLKKYIETSQEINMI